METPHEALAQVRLAYRLVYEYQRAILDLVRHTVVTVSANRSDLSFLGWGPSRHASTPPSSVDPTGDRWAWEFLPLYSASFEWATSVQPKAGELFIWAEHVADDGFKATDGEPHPSGFAEVEACRSFVSFCVISPDAAERDLSWDDLFWMAQGPRGELWQDGRVHPFSGSRASFRYGGVRCDAAALASQTASAALLIKPLEGLVEGVGSGWAPK